MFNSGDFEAAVFAYTKLNRVKPDNPPLLVALAQSQYQAGDIEAARASLHHIRALDPKHFVANNSLVDLDINAGELDEALAFAKEIKAVAPDQAARLTSKVLMEKTKAARRSPFWSRPLPKRRRHRFRERSSSFAGGWASKTKPCSG